MRGITSLFILLALESSSLLCAQEIKLSGKVYHDDETLKEAIVQVSSQDSVYYSISTNRRGKFKIKLPAGRIYELEISKAKYVAKTILLTAFISKTEKSKSFEFDVNLHKRKEFRYVENPSESDPIAHIFYDNTEKELEWDRELTQRAHQKIEELKELNKAKRYEKYSRF